MYDDYVSPVYGLGSGRDRHENGEREQGRAHPRNVAVLLALSRMVGSWLTAFGAWSSRPSAFLIVVAYAALWLVFERETFDWHGVATLATWTMTLFIQRAEHRDTQAIHAKLDELLHVHNRASNELTRLDDREPEEIEKHRHEARRGD